jgi:glucokinase
MILAGDIGGTNSRMALFTREEGRLRVAAERKYPSQQHQGLEEIVNLFLAETGTKVEAACCGIAGPVVQGKAVASNLPWIADAAEIARQTGIAQVWLINDLQAHASGIDDLEAADLVALNAAQAGQGNAALIAAGTGLGEAGMYWDGRRRHAFAGEGGHADFAPRTDVEVKLHVHLMQKFGHVSCERVLSGPGLKNIYDFLRDSCAEPEPGWLKDELQASPNPAAVISQYGLAGQASICVRALDIFTSVYGAEAGNLALRMLAIGGVFISGGIAGKILPKLRSRIFFDAFVDKGRMKPLLESIPVKVIVNDRVGLIGAACYAMRRQETFK